MKTKKCSAVKIAMQESIAHWERLAAGDLTESQPGPNSCALCKLFRACHNCPVYLHTGERACNDTPYRDAWRAYLDHGADSPEFLAAAAEELEFLKTVNETI